MNSTVASGPEWHAAGIVICRGDGDAREYLLVKNRRTGEWTPPKGWKDDSETNSVATAIREVFEETSLSEKDYRILDVEPFLTQYRVRGEMKRTRYYFAILTNTEAEASPRESKGEIISCAWYIASASKAAMRFDEMSELIDQATSVLDEE